LVLLAAGLLGNVFLSDQQVRQTIDTALPVLGTLGLILIVLEASLDLDVHRGNLARLAQALLAAIVATVGLSFILGLGMVWFLGLGQYQAGLLAIPLAVVSSAVAIPAAQRLGDEAREFITYESAFADIIGVLLFYSWLGSGGVASGFAVSLLGGGLATVAISVVFVLGLYLLMNRLTGHVRFVPMMAGLLLLYSTGKALNLSPLLLVLAFGLFLSNLPSLQRRSRLLRRWGSEDFPQTTKEFKAQVTEFTFAVRSIFFILLGLWTDLTSLLAIESVGLAAVILICIYLIRWPILWLVRAPLRQGLVWVSPRGLITVLLILIAFDQTDLSGKVFPTGAVMWVGLVSSA
ncbi:MAG: cation:proton antiporter, partial [Burkholderiaceae bacterium]